MFITSSTFSAEARQYADGVTTRIVLVDGDQLADLMIRHAVGVRTEATYEIKRPDLDYFGDDVEVADEASKKLP